MTSYDSMTLMTLILTRFLTTFMHVIYVTVKYLINLNYCCNQKKNLYFSVHKAIYNKSHINEFTTVLLRTGDDKMVKRLFYTAVRPLMMGR